MDKGKHHGAVNKSSSDQQFHKLTAISEKTGDIALVQPGLTAGRQAGRQMKYCKI